VVARFRQGHLLVVPGVGHSVLSADPSGCSQQAVRLWVLGRDPPATCPRPKAFVSPLPLPAGVRQKRLTAQQTLAVAATTLREAEAAWLMAIAFTKHPPAVAGLAAGTLVPVQSAFTLERYGIAAGVALSGRVTITDIGPPTSFRGWVDVAGTAAAAGRLTLSGTGLHGRLGGRRVG
jgi:hypothetical protein